MGERYFTYKGLNDEAELFKYFLECIKKSQTVLVYCPLQNSGLGVIYWDDSPCYENPCYPHPNFRDERNERLKKALSGKSPLADSIDTCAIESDMRRLVHLFDLGQKEERIGSLVSIRLINNNFHLFLQELMP